MDYEKSCVLGVYGTNDGASERIYGINQVRQRCGVNRYAISSSMTGETLPSRKSCSTQWVEH